jgi:hypothetical protein
MSVNQDGRGQVLVLPDCCPYDPFACPAPLPESQTTGGQDEGVGGGGGKNPGGVRVLLANPRWERQLVKFLELSGEG